MTRSKGRNSTPRQPVVPDTPAGDYIGESDRQKPGPRPYNSPIPGGSTGGPHIGNQPTVRQKVPVPEWKPEFRGMMAHGVPAENHTSHEHAEHTRGPDNVKAIRPHYEDATPRGMPPVPVYLVPKAGGARPLHTLAGDKFLVPAKGTAAIRIAGRDHDRQYLCILNETASTIVNASGGNPTPGTVNGGSVPATGVNFQNPFYYGVQVVISANGATISNVSVNGTTVGTGAGTYFLQPGQVISVAYTVATPTWVWTYNGPNIATTTSVLGVRIDHEVGNLDVGFGTLIPAGMNNYLKLETNDEVFAVSADTNTCVLDVLYLYDVPAAGG